jgi:hypothetical protein
MNESTIEQAIGKIHLSGGSMPLADFEDWVLGNVFGADWDTYKAATGRLIYDLEHRKLIRMKLDDEGFVVTLNR